ncbi:PKD domain-containing protein [Rhodocaloribacter litoris]|uniref:PKD domain-containing protein n=1 Tax=Rhodocaloribacter litoris TaxID=2558931 RepID=UPI00142264BF|nr:PKD domain-containing protein [Rhodocaloribacter litoris]QXD14970.1 PKD domain-containing protein [Rhodocaloribacter litoris]
MKRPRSFHPLIFTLLALLLGPVSLQGQNVRPDKSFYIKPEVGLSSYLGDNERSPFNFNMDAFKVDGKAPISAGLELGYQATQRFDVSLGYRYGQYPVIRQFGDALEPQERRDTDRHTLNLLFRYTIMGDRWRVAPFVQAGANATLGFQDPVTGDRPIGWGPSAGLGLDVAVSGRTSLVFEWNTDFSLDDAAVDGTTDGGFGSVDALNGLTFGVKYSFRKAFSPVQVYGISGPATLQVGETGTFTADTNLESATQPVSYTWTFGDGTEGRGVTVRHAYDRPGTYTVAFTAENDRSTDTETFTVEVVPPPVPAQIVSLTASPTAPDTQTEVTFTATVTGDAPLAYRWQVNDGTTAEGERFSHTFSEPGTYEVSLTVTNEHGTDTETLTIPVVPYEPPFCASLLTMNEVYFDRNGSTLTEEGRIRLRENVEVLAACERVQVRIEGWAAANERNPDELSTARAEAVRAFYVSQGIPAERISTHGMGAAAPTTTKEGASRYQRADSIPRQDHDR